MILYRPVGLQELELIYDNGMESFPARLPQQPIFYPVLQLEYARQIASEWNAKSGQSAGYVTQFKVEDQYIGQFEEHTVGGSQHQEFWIPAEEMEEFNQHISGHIKVLEAHFGDEFEGFIPEKFGLQGKNAVEQFTLLANSFIYKRMDFYLEIKRNHKAVFLNYPFWQQHDFKNAGLKKKVLQAIKEAWLTSFPKIPLPMPPAGHEDIPPAEQIDPDSVTDSVQEDGMPAEQISAQQPAKPVPEDPSPVKRKDSHSSVDPVDDDLIFLKQKHAHAWQELVNESITPIEQTDSDSLEEDGYEETSRIEHVDADVLVNSAHEDTSSVKDTDSYDEMDSDDEDDEDSDQPDTYARSLVDAADEDITSIEQPDAQPRFSLSSNYKDTKRVQPAESSRHFLQGVELGLRRMYQAAADELSKAVEEAPDDVVTQTSLGVAFHRLGEDDRALSCYEAALKRDPIHAEAHYFRANILYSQGDVREAIAGYTIAIGLQPELIEAHHKPVPQDRLTDYTASPAEMVWIARPAHRILELNKLLETNPRHASFFKERAAAYSRLRNFAQAVTDYGSYLAIRPDDANVLHLRGLIFEQVGQFDRALEDYQRAVAIDPQLSDEYINRGVAFGNMGNFRQSIVSLTEAIRLVPKNPDGYFNRGAAYFQQGDYESAIDDFSSVIRLSPMDEAACYWRGMSNEQAGHRREAIADYRQFLTLSRDANARMEVEQKLRQWEGERNEVRDRSIHPDKQQKTDPVLSKSPGEGTDLNGLIVALGKRALHSIWLASGVDCYGEKAEELSSLTEQNQPIEGHDFLRITSGIQQTVAGDFTAFDPGSTLHWVFIRAWDGNGFYIETNEPEIRERLKKHYPSVEQVEGASPPYQSLFIRM
jgi:tetratricopeptide (TPR) repeat protein